MGVVKKLYIVRHGQTDYNRLNIIQGSGIDSDLNTIGLEQAQHFYKGYKETPFDFVYTSQLKRTYQSVSGFIQSGILYGSHRGLNEINWGVLEGKQSNNKVQALFHKTLEKWHSGKLDFALDGGESPLQMMERQKQFLDHMLSTPHETILIASHGRAMRSFLCLLTGVDARYMYQFPHTNLGLYVLEQTDDMLFRVVKQNSTTHLPPGLITAYR